MSTSINNQRKNVTAKDVANLAGVSQSTVSRVLNTKSKSSFISLKTAERVRLAAAQLNYSPNPIARALRGEGTHLLALLVREIADPFFAEFISVISDEARKIKYNVVLSPVHSDPQEAASISRVFDERQVDGVIFVGDLREDLTFLQTLVDNQHPVVALCRGQLRVPIPTINCDNTAGINMLLDHLISFGHRNFAFLDGGWLGDIRERRDAFVKYFSERDIRATFKTFQAEENNFQGGFDAMNTLLSLAPRPTAVLVSDDQMAMGAIRAANQHNIKIPEDLSITGFDGIEMSLFTSPELTTVRQPIEEMGRLTIQKILEQIEGNKVPENEMFVEIPPQLIIRRSTGPVPEYK